MRHVVYKRARNIILHTKPRACCRQAGGKLLENPVELLENPVELLQNPVELLENPVELLENPV